MWRVAMGQPNSETNTRHMKTQPSTQQKGTISCSLPSTCRLQKQQRKSRNIKETVWRNEQCVHMFPKLKSDRRIGEHRMSQPNSVPRLGRPNQNDAQKAHNLVPHAQAFGVRSTSQNSSKNNSDSMTCINTVFATNMKALQNAPTTG